MDKTLVTSSMGSDQDMKLGTFSVQSIIRTLLNESASKNDDGVASVSSIADVEVNLYTT